MSDEYTEFETREHKTEDEFYDWCEYHGMSYAFEVVEKLKQENEKLRECVEFYANDDNWDLVCMRPDGEGSAAPIFCGDHNAAHNLLKDIKQ